MANIEKRHIIDRNNLCEEAYFTSLLQEACACGLLCDVDIENIQMQCLTLLAYKCEKYTGGDSSSVRVEVAENIMKSNLFAISLYLKSLSDADQAVNVLINIPVSDLYQKGRKLIDIKFHAAEHIYKLVQKNRINTRNYSYNDTLSCIGKFFKSYRPDFEAQEFPASIDYQLCQPVGDIEGIEYIQRYLNHLYIENEFCAFFDDKKVHNLLSGYDKGYKELLINVFEQVLIGSIGCSLVNLSIVDLNMPKADVRRLYDDLIKHTGISLDMVIQNAADKVIEELNITNVNVLKYIEKSLPKIASTIKNAVKTNTLDKVFVSSINPDLEPKIEFIPSVKMSDEDYRKIINELSMCRYSSDKLKIIKEKIKAFGDIESVLLDVYLTEKETYSVFKILGDMEIAALIKRHQFNTEVQAEDISEDERALRLCLNRYYSKLSFERQEQISKIIDQLIF